MIVVIHIEERPKSQSVAVTVEIPEQDNITELEMQTCDIFREFMAEFYTKIGVPGSASGFLNNDKN